MKTTSIILFMIALIALVQVIPCDAQAWPQPEALLGEPRYCDNSTIIAQQFCETIHKHPRAVTHIEMTGKNTTLEQLESVAFSFLSMVKVKNPNDVAKGKDPKYDIMSGDCAGAISNLLCARFFPTCDVDEPLEDYQKACKSSCQKAKKNCGGQPMSEYGKTFIKNLDCNDETKYSTKPCTSDAPATVRTIFAITLSLIVSIVMLL